jgi:hypothetical protein
MGGAVFGLWGMLLARHAVPELDAGLPSIRFHIVAELATATALLGCAVWLAVADSSIARLAATASRGAIAYSTINSPGYYADRGQLAVVVMFGVLTILAVTAILVLLVALRHPDRPTESTRPREP